jgi:hypothetical protein
MAIHMDQPSMKRKEAVMKIMVTPATRNVGRDVRPGPAHLLPCHIRYHPHSGRLELPSGQRSLFYFLEEISSAGSVEILNEITGIGGTVHRIEFAPNRFVHISACTLHFSSISAKKGIHDMAVPKA